jgi:hypothetical protein
MKCRFWAGRGANNPIPQTFTFTKPWKRPRLTQGCSTSKKKDEEKGEEEDEERYQDRRMVVHNWQA